MPKVNVYHPCITRISYQQEKGDPNYGTCLWADFEFDTINYRLQIMSDCGNYAYEWVPTPGKESFFGLCRRLDPGYLLNKISSKTVIDLEETASNAIDLIYQSIEYEANLEDDWEELLKCEIADSDLQTETEIADHIVNFAGECSINVDFYDAYMCICKDYPEQAKRIIKTFETYIKPKIPKECNK